ncbi:conjugal transfer protein TrbF [Campylobacter jejuni]|nr:conjugal transfer protein TrbF [Campylobacter jejuni]EAJ7478522.1 conjugal transfer protein TrbF [Campylobacter jejuni]EAJ7480248.1 conjugal transfer protein TrbF [Campylobacter jejuni]
MNIFRQKQKIEKNEFDTSSNPYLNAKTEWLERYGDYITRAKNWQIVAMISLAMCFVCVLFIGYIGSQNKLIPYIVEVDKLGVDAGNLEIIVTSIKEKYPKMNIIIAGDNDVKKELNGNKNVGKETALGIQKKYPEIKVVLPNFTNEESQKGLSDFNDLMKSRGLEEIKKQLKEQIAKQLMAEKATTKALDKNKGINKEISTKKDIGISL